jgi:hypothetical protein
MTRPDERDERSHGEGYPGEDHPDTAQDEHRYGVKPEAPKPDSNRRREPRPAEPPPAHERQSRT